MAAAKNASDLSKLLENWNPMEEVYNNLNFNQYDSGPGANMAPSLHVSHRQSSDQVVLKPFLIFKNVPSQLKEEGMMNLCSRYGKVTAVRFNTKFRKFFVDFKTVSDMEAVFRALGKNEYGFEVVIGKHFNKANDTAKHANLHNTSLRSNQQDTVGVANAQDKHQTTNTGPDLENRNWELSDKQPPRPNFNKTPIVCASDYEKTDNLLKANDPNRWCCIEDDEHAHEAENFKLDMNSYRSGRTYIKMPQQLKENIMGNKEKLGTYNNDTRQYVYVQGNAKRPTNIGICENCGLESDMSCIRCNTYYCSRECQSEAWPKHRLVCTRLAISKTKSINPLPEEKNVITETNAPPVKTDKAAPDDGAAAAATSPVVIKPSKKYNELPGNGETVVIVSITKANVVFVRAKNKEADLNYFKLITKVQADGCKLPNLQSLPKEGQIVVSQFEGQYNRALVLNANNKDGIRLFYLDYGNLDQKPLNELYLAPDNYAQLSKPVIPVLLKNVPDCYITVRLRAFMYSKLENVVFKLKYNLTEDFNDEKGAYAVELVDTMTNQNLNHLVSTLCCPVAKKHADAKCYEYSPAMKHLPLPTGKNVELVVMDNTLLKKGTLYCSTKAFALEIQKFQKDIQLYGESQEKEEGYAPTYLELCIVKYETDNKWYRGVGLENVGDGYPSIQFLDYGNTAAVPLKNIRRYPEQFLIPKFTSLCEIDGILKNVNGNLLARLEKLIPNGSTLVCDEVIVRNPDEDNQYYELKITKIVEQLKQEGLLYDPNSEVD